MSDHNETDLRRTATEMFRAAVQAADPALALRRTLTSTPLPPARANGQTLLIAFGKAAPAMLNEALQHVTGPVTALAVTHHENHTQVPGAEVIYAGHPVPDTGSLRAGQRIADLLAAAGPEDQVIALVSGGGSALVLAPAEGITLQDKADLNRLLLSSGLDIVQMNHVRQSVSRLKGGGFLRLAAPAPVTSYILSDVIGDDLRAVASGPTVAPVGSRADARDICKQAGFWSHLPALVQAHLNTDETATPPLPHVANHLIGSNRESLSAAYAATPDSFSARIVSDSLTGDVADAAEVITEAALSQWSDRPVALLFGGETTVRLRGTGRGGRNQELALRAAVSRALHNLDADWVFLSGGTDGRDGPTDAAGAIVDANTKARIRDAGQDPDVLLANNDSNAALAASGDLLVTKATGTNVGDIQIMLIR